MLRYFFAVFLALGLLVLVLLGVRGQKTTARPFEIFPDMDHQPKVRPQHPSDFFADGIGARHPVPATVPIGYTLPGYADLTGPSNSPVAERGGAFGAGADYLNTGQIGGFWGDGPPIEVTPAFMARGAERYGIHCAVCHGASGAGDGVIKKYGLATIASLQDDRIRSMPDGEIFNTITHGKNTMGAYGAQIAVEDRWAIIAYLRALQRSQRGALEDVPEAARAALGAGAAAAAPAPAGGAPK